MAYIPIAQRSRAAIDTWLHGTKPATQGRVVRRAGVRPPSTTPLSVYATIEGGVILFTLPAPRWWDPTRPEDPA